MNHEEAEGSGDGVTRTLTRGEKREALIVPDARGDNETSLDSTAVYGRCANPPLPPASSDRPTTPQRRPTVSDSWATMFRRASPCAELRASAAVLMHFQKLEREARICRKLQHPNIGKYTSFHTTRATKLKPSVGRISNATPNASRLNAIPQVLVACLSTSKSVLRFSERYQLGSSRHPRRPDARLQSHFLTRVSD
ncbi:Protein of unknown function [Gryllus bimaculatus]|nr:Protein of unknown function [Gryllus bimaculatus]